MSKLYWNILHEAFDTADSDWHPVDTDILKGKVSDNALKVFNACLDSNFSQLQTNDEGKYMYGDWYDDYICDSLDELIKAIEYNAEAWDDESIRELDEPPINLRESLKNLDSQHFDLYSESYELEMLYESVRDTLSAQQKNDLAKFVRKARTAEEVNTYMTGMLAKDEANESLNEEVDEATFNKLKEIAYDLDAYIEDKVWVREFWYDGQFDNTISFEIYGDWKHDHARFKYYASEWLDNKGLRYKMWEVITDEDGSDSYGATHTIRLYDLAEKEL